MTQLFGLKKNPHFKLAMNKGEKWVTKSFVLIVCPLSEIAPFKEGETQIGFGIIASKKVGNAVCRNKAKRRLREIIRGHLPQLGKQGYLYLFIARKEILTYDFAQLPKDLKWSIGRVPHS